MEKYEIDEDKLKFQSDSLSIGDILQSEGLIIIDEMQGNIFCISNSIMIKFALSL